MAAFHRIQSLAKLLTLAQVFISLVTNVVALPSGLTADIEIKGLSVSLTEIEQESDISLAWLNQTTMHIMWPDRTTDIIHLQASKNLDGGPSKCIFNGQFENKTGDTAAVVGCIGSETVVNIAHNGFVSELTLRDGVTLEFIPKEDNQIEGGPRVTREIVTGGFLPVEPRQPISADYDAADVHPQWEDYSDSIGGNSKNDTTVLLPAILGFKEGEGQGGNFGVNPVCLLCKISVHE